MVLTLDVGNTRIKSAVFEHHTMIKSYVFEKNIFEKNILNILKKYPKIKNLIVSSVAKIEDSNFQEIKKHLKITFIEYNTILPFENLYTTPLTMGIDRMVLAAGATLNFSGKNRLVIDAGTCITYDYINKNDQYLGGAISPGLRLRYESLHNYTAKLPLLSVDNPEKIIGNSTNQAIHSGVINGTISEINGFINQFEAENPNFIIILTGGDCDFLAKRLKNTIFANSNFLLESLNLIYLHTNQND
ncbi:MAG: type III pantothenate kinase [Flavobacterium sp.]|nr:type III pantothenate kinase [Flavobacterium sp.]